MAALLLVVRRFTRRHRLLSYNLVLITAILLIQSSAFPKLLDLIVGVRWSSDIVALLRVNTQGFIILLVIQLYLEGTRKDRLEEYMAARTQSAEGHLAQLMEEGSEEELIAYALRRRLGGGPREIASLIRTLLPDRPYFTDTQVEFIFRSVPDDQRLYRLLYRLEFSAVIDEVLFAVARTPLVAESLFASIPTLTELTILQDNEQLESTAEAIADTVSVSLALATGSGAVTNPRIALHRVSPDRAAQYLPAESTLLATDFILYRALLAGPPDAIKHVVFRMRRDTPVVQNCLPWIADRAIFLRSITFDYSAFPDRARFDFHVYPFFLTNRDAHEVTQSTGADSDRLEFSVNQWVTSGQGIMITWQARSPADQIEPVQPAEPVEVVPHLRAVPTVQDASLPQSLPPSG